MKRVKIKLTPSDKDSLKHLKATQLSAKKLKDKEITSIHSFTCNIPPQFDSELTLLQRKITQLANCNNDNVHDPIDEPLNEKSILVIGNMLDCWTKNVLVGETPFTLKFYVYRKYYQEIIKDPLLNFDPIIIWHKALSELMDNWVLLWINLFNQNNVIPDFIHKYKYFLTLQLNKHDRIKNIFVHFDLNHDLYTNEQSPLQVLLNSTFTIPQSSDNNVVEFFLITPLLN